MKRWVYFLPLILLIALAAMLYSLLQQNLKMVTQPPSVVVDRALPSFAINGLSNNDIKGASLLHITASWCAACKIEHPLLVKLAKKIPIYGVAWKDKPEALQTWLKQAGSPYQKIGYDDGMLGLELGISGTPESFLISKDRRIIAHFKGPLTEDQIEHDILDRLK
jgi:cytochrome c biogenesis protein CcmG/thiol:disulfide interchange protein DsbE